MESRFKLKLLNGPLAGRELLLPTGDFTVGGDDSDLSLPLEGGQVATLTSSMDSLELKSETPCWVAGRAHAPGALPAHTAIDVAGVHFVFGRTDLALPAVTIAPRARPSLTLFMFLIVTGIVGLGIALAFVVFRIPSPQGLTPKESLEKALLSMPELKAHWMASDTVAVVGHCSDSTKLSPIVAQLNAVGVRLQLDAVCDDELKNAISSIFSSYGYPNVKVNLDVNGNADIDGSVKNDKTFSSLAEALDALPGLHTWHLSDRTADELTTIVSRLTEGHVLDGISAKRDERNWVLSGLLEPRDRLTLLRFVDSIGTDGGITTPVRFVSAESVARAQDYLSASVAGISGSSSAPYVELTDGLRLQRGSPVGHGLRVVAISRAGVSLASDHELIFLPIRR